MRKRNNEDLGRLQVDDFKRAEKVPLTLVLDNVRSLNNIGSIFRTADAFLLEKIYLCGITAVPPHKDITKTALGATESVAWEYREDTVALLHDLRRTGHGIWAVEQTENAVFLDTFKVGAKKKYVLVFGNEVKGVSQEAVDACDGAVEIPQFGTKHSLNVAVSVGVVVWDLWAKLQRVNAR